MLWNSGVSAFSGGVSANPATVNLSYRSLNRAFPDHRRDEADDTQPWTPHDFYNSVHVPARDVDVKEHFQDVLDTELYPFQKRAVHWMLEREGVQLSDGQIRKIPNVQNRRDVKFFHTSEDLNGNTCYVSNLQGIAQRDPPSEEDKPLLGGLLAEEMGLGKTVELLALVRSHPQVGVARDRVFDAASNTHVTPSKATLIITPPTILQQWLSELAKHAPALKVLVYEGITAKSSKDQTQLFADLTTNYDVVLTTYNTLGREIYFAEDPPERNMRHKPKFERKKSPLVQIQWWRICLDEAQMVESGVTAAARVARVLPRVNSWAVSGTPLRKDVSDLHGLLIFLRFKPLCDDAKLWRRLIADGRHLFRDIFKSIALRHTKAQIREDLNLPPQKRVVITVPFTAIEQQHYGSLFKEMCQAVGVGEDGSPTSDQWDPEDPATVEAMRTFLVRLRQTCLHPGVGGKNRKALGKGTGPLRTVDEVLEVMIDNNETSIRTGERTLLATQLLRGHIYAYAGDDPHRYDKALPIYLDAVSSSEVSVKECRDRLVALKASQHSGDFIPLDGKVEMDETDDEDSSSESAPIIGRERNNLRTSLQMQHACTFFAATAYFLIKSDESLTPPDSDRFKELEEKEMSLYERAKLVRREILKASARRAESVMSTIRDMQAKDELTKIPKIKDLESLGGIESRRIVEKSDLLFDGIRALVQVIVGWRSKMAEFLLKPLVDNEDADETTGEEYEDSTKQQDELYAYFDACKFIQADLNTVISGEAAPLIDHEAQMLRRHAKIAVHAPELTLELLTVRNKLRDDYKDIGSIRGLIQETRGLETSLHGHESGARAVERVLVRKHLSALQSVFTTYTKTLEALEKEIDLFRSTQNRRLEFYRQLQELSDAVKPYKEELDEHLDAEAMQAATHKEMDQKKNLSKSKSHRRYLLSLRDKTEPEICIICVTKFENGVLTTCGHQFCKECIQQWWSSHQNCPKCRTRLKSADFYNVTYKPQLLRAQEEVLSNSTSPDTSASPSSSSQNANASASIYADVDTHLLQEIQSTDLPAHYGTKIDTLGRQLHWLRSHDPGAKTIVFSQFREFLDILGTALRDFKIGYARLGRPGAVEKFKHDPSIDCLLLDAKTDSSGLTLVNATHVIICEPLVQTAVELQAIARVHRIGQTRPTTVWMYLTQDSVEESIYELSVTRRLAHVQSRQQKTKQAQKSRSSTPAPQLSVQQRENAIEVANSEELQSQPISKLLVPGKGGGEIVGNGDLWQCLFGKAKKVPEKGMGQGGDAMEDVRPGQVFQGSEEWMEE
ncbi:SNF2 family DNA-dependent ATPase domain-containing protein [Neohortaea acidophila]|uniref:SNF2 family DNA-dependent ATPase domain-containing protein n=1 Tax=Neohortaea acidophila TaxID=245834 RepID=A0A6A6PLT6_9PEZI|nr:SNF2 family DNA-dependent ATPase domain-containing protein [Neohortaea acidophila]KAF2480624.1 SNF2 family DNA-dependent ATPase domain-containing protein [Neohortaea acidophila]